MDIQDILVLSLTKFNHSSKNASIIKQNAGLTYTIIDGVHSQVEKVFKANLLVELLSGVGSKF